MAFGDTATTTTNGHEREREREGEGEGESVETPQQLIDSARRHAALKEWDAAIDQLGRALEMLREAHAEDADLLAPVLHLYGRALLESAILNSGALGGGGSKDAPMPSKASSSAPGPADPRFSFSGDAESDGEHEPSDAPAEQPAEGGDGDGDEDEDEDDLGVAFSVLDLARVIYQRILDTDAEGGARLTTLDGSEWDRTRLSAELAEVLNDLGDVGLESENFQQASADYRAALDLLAPLLHPYSRRLADAHLRLGLALEFHPTVAEREGALQHVKAAAQTLQARLDALNQRKEGKLAPPSKHAPTSPTASASASASASAKGKGKAADAPKAERDDVLEMSEDKLDLEIKDVAEMKNELDVKVGTPPPNPAATFMY